MPVTPRKRRSSRIAEGLLRKLWETRLGRLSVQVLNEYYVNVTSKLDPGLSHEEAWADVEQLQMWNPEPIDFGLINTAIP